MTNFDDDGRCGECGCELNEGCSCDPKCDYCDQDEDDDFELTAPAVAPTYNVCESCQ